MNKGLTFCLLFLAGAFLGYAQYAGNSTAANDFRTITSSSSGMWVKPDEGVKIKGSPYLFEDWKTSAVVVAKDQKMYKIDKVNYDAKLDQIVAKISKDSVFSFNPANIDKVVINNREFKRYLDPELGRNSYYEMVASANGVEVLKRNMKVVKEGVFNPMTQQKQTPDAYSLNSKYFLRKKDVLTELPLKKSKVLKAFEAKESEVKKFIKDNGLSVRNEGDLKKIFIYFDSL